MPKKLIHTARFVAAETLCNLFKQRISIKILFNRVAEKFNLPQKERNLAMNLIYGVLRQRQSVDAILEERSRTPLQKLDPFVHQVLAVGLYQIFFLDNIPYSAAVNEAVNSCKVKGLPKRLQGFVNGVLRETVRRRKNKSAIPGPDSQPVYNHPDWLVNRWMKAFGKEETIRICSENSKEPLLILRVNSGRCTKENLLRLFDQKKISHRPGKFAMDSIILPDFHGPINLIPGFEQGFFQIQNEAAQLATLLLGPFKRRGKYLDGCAGVGGKTSYIIQLGMENNIRTYAVEPEKRRLKKLLENCRRLLPQNDLSTFETTLHKFSSECTEQFDGILIDAPCSGTGVIGRHPDIRWNRSQNDLQRYQQKQLELLEQAHPLLKQKGVLVYATCSLEHEENQDVIHTFLAHHPEFSLSDCREYLPRKAHKLVTDKFFSPHPSSAIDGFFGARMELT